MLTRRISLHGLLAVLLALMAQLAVGASVPRPDPIAQLSGFETYCHVPDGAGGDRTPAPMHSADCLLCPLCVAMHAPAAILVSACLLVLVLVVPTTQRQIRLAPGRAPPARDRPPSQPRAPPVFS